MAEPSYKVVLLGEGRVGKTSLIARYVHDNFHEQEPSTVQATMYSTKAVTLDDSTTGAGGGARTVQLNLWDTAGQERFHALAPIYYRQAEGAMLVYDVTDADTLRRVRVWVQELRAVAGGGICVVICGNKADCPETEWDVTEEEALALAEELGAEHLWTSAKSGKNVDAAFSQIANLIASHDRRLQQQPLGGAPRAGGAGRRRGRGLQVADSPEAEEEVADSATTSAATAASATQQSPERTKAQAASRRTVTLLEPNRNTNGSGGGGANRGNNDGGSCC